MKTEQPTLITSVTANADLSNKQHRMIDVFGMVCNTPGTPIGVLAANTELGEQAPLICSGIALVLSGAGMAAGTACQSDDYGRAVAVTIGTRFGFTLDTCAGADELIRVLIR